MQIFFPLALGLAVTGLVFVGIGAWRLAQNWRVLPAPRRWALFVGLGAAEMVIWLCVYAFLIEPRTLVVRHVEIVSEHWRGAPVTIAALGDTHVPGPHMSVTRMGRVVARVNALQPDLVVLLGDYVSRRTPEAERSLEAQGDALAGVATFAGFTAPLGVVAVLGNHDVWHNRTSIARALEDAGVAALWDRHVVISRPDGDIVVVGLADAVAAHAHYEEAIDGAPQNADAIVLSHSPDAYVNVPAGPALMLAGHSHCGQVSVPLIGRPMVPLWNPRFACHRIDEDGKIIYVTAGVGTSFLPVRFLNPPEIVLIRLRGPASNDPSGGTAEG